jgi:hypothetical protein
VHFVSECNDARQEAVIDLEGPLNTSATSQLQNGSTFILMWLILL